MALKEQSPRSYRPFSRLKSLLIDRVNVFSSPNFSRYQTTQVFFIALFVINVVYQVLAVYLETDPFTPNYFITLAAMAVSLYLLKSLIDTGEVDRLVRIFIPLSAFEQCSDILFDNPSALVPNMLWFIVVIWTTSLTSSIKYILSSALACALFLGIAWFSYNQGIGVYGQRSINPVLQELNGLYFICFIISFGTLLAVIQHNFFKAQEKIHYAATRDKLTSLFNRNALERDLRCLFERFHRLGEDFSLVFADLDQFKQVNDLWGHRFGDRVLKQVGQRLVLATDTTDLPNGVSIKAYRHGGDEFVLAVSSKPDKAWFDRFLNALSSTISQPYAVDDLNITIKISFGLAFSDDQAESVDELLHYADIAMYVAKRSGRIAQPSQLDYRQSWTRQFAIFHHLRNNKIHDEFHLVYQPIHNSLSRECDKVEALLRWNSPFLGELGPDEFIPLAESSGIMSEIMLWVMEQCSFQLAQLFRRRPNFRVSINLSPFVLQNSNILLKLDKVVNHLHFDKSRFIFEITESSPILNNAQVNDLLRKMKKQGYFFSLDDFGAGNSSFLSLKSGIFTEIKLDRSLVLESMEIPATQSIVRSTIQSAHAMGMNVVSEGIETAALRNHMTILNSDELQGFFLQKPLKTEDLCVYIDLSAT